MYLTRSGRHFVDWQVDIISSPRRLAASGGELIGNRTDGGVLDRHRRLQRPGGIMVCRSVHHLCPDRQRECGAVTVRNNRGRLIKPDPNPARQRAGITEKPGIFVIVSRAGFAGCR